MASKEAQIEYEKLEANEIIPRELLNHPKFYQQFCHTFDLMTENGRYSGQIEIGYNKFSNVITMSQYRQDPNFTTDTYKGYKDLNTVTIGLKNHINNMYLCVDSDSCLMVGPTVYSKNQDTSVCSVRKIQLFNEYEEIGQQYVSMNTKGNFSNDIRLYRISPQMEMSIGGILNADKPSFNPNNTLSTDDMYTSTVCRRRDGIATRHYFSKRNNEYEERIEYVALDNERPETLENLGTGCIAYQDNNTFGHFILPQGSEFTSVEEALEYHRNCSNTSSRSR